MEMLNIEDQLNKISEILIDCRQLVFDSHSIIVTKTNSKHIIVSRDKFLTCAGEVFWKLAIIELTKLYNDSDDLNIVSLFKHVRLHSQSQWGKLIAADELRQLNSVLANRDTKSRVKKLKELRNQHFAHTNNPPDNNVYDIRFYFEDCIFLIEKAEYLVSTLSYKLLKQPILFKKYKGEDVDLFLDKHIEYIEIIGKYKLGKKISNN